MKCGTYNVNCSNVLIIVNILLGNADWLTDWIYVTNYDFVAGSHVKNAAIAFIMLQPMWYCFAYLLYICRHQEYKLPPVSEEDSDAEEDLNEE